jgi:hypothetical protein
VLGAPGADDTAPSQVQAQIADFVKGDVIDLKGILASSLSYSGQRSPGQ